MQRTTRLSFLAVTAALGCASAREPPAAGAGPEAVAVSDGDTFEADFGSVAVTTDWSWQLAASDLPDSGRCAYDHAVVAPALGRWLVTYSSDDGARDPISGAAFANGYYTIVADGTLPQIAVHGDPSQAYRCSDRVDPPASAAATEMSPGSLHLEIVLGVHSDRVRTSGYVTRLFMTGMGAPIDSANGRPVSLGFSIPAPLVVEASVRSAGSDGDDSILLSLSGSEDSAPPRFELDLYTGIDGMSAKAAVQFQNLRLHRP